MAWPYAERQGLRPDRGRPGEAGPAPLTFLPPLLYDSAKGFYREGYGMHREIAEATQRTPQLIGQLLEVWERSVRATHLFLSAGEIAEIKPYVPQALREVPDLIVAWREDGTPAGFMGIDGQKLEMLFLAPEERGRGLGGKLVRYGVERFDIREVTVNEQNPQARGFYDRMGFRACRRSELDEQGRPYPILNMRL